MARILSVVLSVVAVASQVRAAPMMMSSSYGGNNNYQGGSDNQASTDYQSSNSYQGSSNYQASNNYAQQMDDTTTKMMDEMKSTTMMMEATQTMAAEAMMTSSMSSDTTTYGSGYMNWGGQGYNDCVQQCVANYGNPAATYTAAAVAETATATTTQGTGTTHTVIVAPTQGVLRYVPFSVNASIGDTVQFIWGAGPHTVTRSSELTPCNASTGADTFASGRQNKSFVFNQVVNDTDPVFYYCGVPGHCEKGMFGIINPPNADVAASSGTSNSSMTVQQYVMSAAQTDSTMAGLWNYVQNQTMNTSAYNWGMWMDMSNMPAEQYSAIAQNTMYSALFYSANPGMLEAGKGAFDVSGKGIVVPADLTSAIAQTSSSSSTASSDAAGYGTPDNAASTSPSADAATASASAASSNSGYGASGYGTTSSGAGQLTSSTLLVGLVAGIVSMLVL